jgi:hypothetical protein
MEVAPKRKRAKRKVVAFDEQRGADVRSDEQLAEVGDDEQRRSADDFLRRKRRPEEGPAALAMEPRHGASA